MGVTRNVEWNNRPESHFLVETNLAEVDLRKRRPRDSFEYQNLMFVKKDDEGTIFSILNDKGNTCCQKSHFSIISDVYAFRLV